LGNGKWSCMYWSLGTLWAKVGLMMDSVFTREITQRALFIRGGVGVEMRWF
jgi:hypothetical protein